MLHQNAGFCMGAEFPRVAPTGGCRTHTHTHIHTEREKDKQGRRSHLTKQQWHRYWLHFLVDPNTLLGGSKTQSVQGMRTTQAQHKHNTSTAQAAQDSTGQHKYSTNTAQTSTAQHNTTQAAKHTHTHIMHTMMQTLVSSDPDRTRHSIQRPVLHRSESESVLSSCAVCSGSCV